MLSLRGLPGHGRYVDASTEITYFVTSHTEIVLFFFFWFYDISWHRYEAAFKIQNVYIQDFKRKSLIMKSGILWWWKNHNKD